MVDTLTVELVMSEFGGQRQNAGGNSLDALERLEPALSSFRAKFPHSTAILYTDQPNWPPQEGITLVVVEPPFDRAHPRYGWRAHDYYQAYGLLRSKADVAIALDADFRIISDEFEVIAQMALTFGLALPMNPRMILRIDGGIGVDSTYQRDEDATRGLGMTYNLTPIAFATAHPQARRLLERYIELMLQTPGRGAVHLVAATYEVGYQPHVLSLQWCVSSPRDLDSKHIWAEAVALHVGHADVEPRHRRAQMHRRWRMRLRGIIGRA